MFAVFKDGQVVIKMTTVVFAVWNATGLFITQLTECILSCIVSGQEDYQGLHNTGGTKCVI